MSYNFERFTYAMSDGSHPKIYLIETNIDNIETKTILKPISKTSHIGVNGGFFDAEYGYNEPSTGGSSICYSKYDEGDYVKVEGRKLPANFHRNEGSSNKPIERKTMFIYKKSSRKIRANFRYVKHVDEIFDEFGENNVLYAMGGNDYNKESWGKSYYLPMDRTVVAWTSRKIYLIHIPGISIPSLKELMESGLGYNLNPVDSVLFDGSGSSCIQGEENGRIKCFGGNRYIYNMIKVINE